MMSKVHKPITASRALLHQLRDLGQVHAPATILPTVLERIGHSDAYALCETPIGLVFVAYNGLGVSAVLRADSATAFEQAFHARFTRPLRQAAALPITLARMVQQHLSGKARSALQVDLRGLSEFERTVLHKVREIPRGELRSYAWVAGEINHPRAVRAVGSALGHNPVPLLIPCHRVGRSDGRLGDYVFGRETKRTLLQAEGVDVATLERLASTGVRYYGSDTTHIYCFPTCRHARRITGQHRVPFRSAAEAAVAGYRPCTACRPAQAA
ncbi:MAG TPA: methylated-DNA--[protein]-cysteine S-methyltransferase [Candidatus Tectomicrobia bacterium]|jgi:O-6-methylguanine DNA methyltransferase